MVNPAGNQPAPTKPRKAEEKPKTENAGNVGPENTDVKPSGPSGLSGPADAPNPSGAPASSGTFGTHSAQDGLDPKTHFLVGQNRNTNNAGGPSGPMPSGPPRASGTSYSIQQTVDENGNYTYKEEGNNSEGSWSIESTNGPSGSTYSETFTPHDNTNASGQSGPNPSGQSGPSPSGQSGPNPSGQSGPNPSGQSGPNPSGQSGPSPSGQSGPNPSGQSGPNPSGQQSGVSGPNPSGQSGPNSKDESAIAGADYAVHKDGKLDRDATAENIISDTEGIIGGWTDSEKGELTKKDIERAQTSINKNKDTVENHEAKLDVLNNLEENFDSVSKDGRITKESLSNSLYSKDGQTIISASGPKPSGTSGPATSGQSGPNPSGQSGPATSGQSGPNPSGQSGPATSGQSGPAPSGASGPSGKTPDKDKPLGGDVVFIDADTGQLHYVQPGDDPGEEENWIIADPLPGRSSREGGGPMWMTPKPDNKIIYQGKDDSGRDVIKYDDPKLESERQADVAKFDSERPIKGFNPDKDYGGVVEKHEASMKQAINKQDKEFFTKADLEAIANGEKDEILDTKISDVTERNKVKQSARAMAEQYAEAEKKYKNGDGPVKALKVLQEHDGLFKMADPHKKAKHREMFSKIANGWTPDNLSEDQRKDFEELRAAVRYTTSVNLTDERYHGFMNKHRTKGSTLFHYLDNSNSSRDNDGKFNYGNYGAAINEFQYAIRN